MNADSARKTTSGCTHHASRRVVSPKPRRPRTTMSPMTAASCPEPSPSESRRIEAQGGGGCQSGGQDGVSDRRAIGRSRYASEMNERDARLDGWSWAILFVRWILGLIFFMAGWWKTFDLGPLEHARRLFVEPYADSWIPTWLLWVYGSVIPIVELIAGALMCLGLRVRAAGVAFGFILVVVAYGHLLKEALFD